MTTARVRPSRNPIHRPDVPFFPTVKPRVVPVAPTCEGYRLRAAIFPAVAGGSCLAEAVRLLRGYGRVGAAGIPVASCPGVFPCGSRDICFSASAHRYRFEPVLIGPLRQEKERSFHTARAAPVHPAQEPEVRSSEVE